MRASRSSAGDQLLFALAYWRSASWEQFKKAADSIYEQQTRSDWKPVSIHRWETLRLLSALGHCEFALGESIVIETLPAKLVRIPQSGLPTAVLCGARSPTTVGDLKEAAQSLSQWAEVKTLADAGRQ